MRASDLRREHCLSVEQPINTKAALNSVHPSVCVGRATEEKSITVLVFSGDCQHFEQPLMDDCDSQLNHEAAHRVRPVLQVNAASAGRTRDFTEALRLMTA